VEKAVTPASRASTFGNSRVLSTLAFINSPSSTQHEQTAQQRPTRNRVDVLKHTACRPW
jgi:hypothetical protein